MKGGKAFYKKNYANNIYNFFYFLLSYLLLCPSSDPPFPGKPFGSCEWTSCRSEFSANGRASPYGTPGSRAGSCTEAWARPIRRRYATCAVRCETHRIGGEGLGVGRECVPAFTALCCIFQVKAFCDVDDNKIQKGFYTYEDSKVRPATGTPNTTSLLWFNVTPAKIWVQIIGHPVRFQQWFISLNIVQQRPKPKIPVLHYKDAAAPFIVCVKLVSRRLCVVCLVFLTPCPTSLVI